MEYYSVTVLSGVIAILTAKYIMPRFIKLLKLDSSVLQTLQALMICYAVIFCLIMPFTTFGLGLLHFITPL
jgi:hypothetical protein